jgi:sterol desaturase/sphingolipid hydroxylase (fatty acid hydroxylase superfamily)
LTCSFQGLWDNFLHIVGEDPFTLWVNGTTILNLVVYWLFGGIYTILNVTNKPAALRRYKMQPGTNEPVDYKKLSRVLVWVLFNQIVVGYVTAWILYKAMSWRGYPEPHHLPSLLQFLSETFFHVLVEEVAFYYSHRLLHTRYLYKFIHKRHHEWTSPIAVTAIYCHPIEHFISNLLPPCLGVFIMGSHILTTWTWFILALFTTLNAHCGYHIPLFPSPEAHDYHHLKYEDCKIGGVLIALLFQI